MIQTLNDNPTMSAIERELLTHELGGTAPLLLLRTRTRIDTGGWLRRSPLWLCVTDRDILLLAASKRRYVQRMLRVDCKGGQYCHTTGDLLLQPSDFWHFNTIALPPADALRVLEYLDNAQDPSSHSPVTEPTGA